MKKNLTARTVVIVVTILICVFGIIGFPKIEGGRGEEFQQTTSGSVST